ncbi:hypothetical protein ACFWGI_36680 [Streptomyces niveus]
MNQCHRPGHTDADHTWIRHKVLDQLVRPLRITLGELAQGRLKGIGSG